MDPDLEPFLSFYRKQKIVFWVLAAIFVVVGVVVFLCAHDRKMTEHANLVLRIVAGGAIAAFGGLMGFLASRPPEREKALLTLLSRAADVVWVIPTIHKQNGSHVRTSYTLKLVDRGQAVLSVSPRNQAAAEAALKRRCPRARFGYDPDWEQLYNSNPVTLRS